MCDCPLKDLSQYLTLSGQGEIYHQYFLMSMDPVFSLEELGPQESFGQQIKSISVVFTGMFLLLVYDSLDVTESDSGIEKSLAPTPEFSTKK